MAEKSRGGGLGWFIVGLLAGVALTLFALVFINLRGDRREADSRSGADDAAATAIQSDPTAVQAPVAAAPVVETPAPKASQPVTAADTAAAERAAAQAADDAQMRDDAAAVGDTSRASPPQ